jgi:prepilin-type N-terminal cleavage/methylation domain-containing protein
MQRALEVLQRQRLSDDEGGFTLTEVLITIVILGILASIVIFAVQALGSTGAQSGCRADYKTVERAMEAFDAQMGHYPTAADAGGSYAPPAGIGTTLPAGGIDLIGALMTEQGANGPGPWLRDFPGNASHYQIAVMAGNVVEVYKSNGSAPVATTPTRSAGDCASVS